MHAPARHCRWCGATTCEGTCASGYEVPAYCPECGQRLVVQVRPLGFRARCRAHGPLTSH